MVGFLVEIVNGEVGAEMVRGVRALLLLDIRHRENTFNKTATEAGLCCVVLTVMGMRRKQGWQLLRCGLGWCGAAVEQSVVRRAQLPVARALAPMPVQCNKHGSGEGNSGRASGSVVAKVELYVSECLRG